jgi:hypothetical protein
MAVITLERTGAAQRAAARLRAMAATARAATERDLANDDADALPRPTGAIGRSFRHTQPRKPAGRGTSRRNQPVLRGRYCRACCNGRRRRSHRTQRNLFTFSFHLLSAARPDFVSRRRRPFLPAECLERILAAISSSVFGIMRSGQPSAIDSSDLSMSAVAL